MNDFLSENNELPRVLLDLVAYYRGPGRKRLEELKSLFKNKKDVVFLGMGTSEFTPLCIQWDLSRLGFFCRIADAGEWYYYGTSPGQPESILIFTSQSGESVEVKNFTNREDIRGNYISITNDERSTMAKNGRLTLPLCAGEEQSITTKTYTNNIALLHLIAAVMSPDDRLDRTLDELEAAVVTMKTPDSETIKNAASSFAPSAPVIFVGRGHAHVSARQCALTFMEGTRCISASFTGGAFNHGPLEAVDKNTYLIVFQPKGRTYQLIENLLWQTRKLGAHVLSITDAASGLSDMDTLFIPRCEIEHSEYLFPILAAPVHNILLYYIARNNGIEAGQFRYGGKITTRE